MADNKIIPPEQQPFGQNNPWLRTKRPTVTDSELERKRREEHTNPDVSKEVPGPLLGIALDASFDMLPPFPPDIATKYQNAQKLIAVKVQIIEQDRVPHPDEGVEYEDGEMVSEDAMLFLFDTFIAASDDVKQPASKGDYVLVDYDNRLTRSGPKYYGLKYRGSSNSGKKKDKKGGKTDKLEPNLQDTTSAPSSGSPIPQSADSTDILSRSSLSSLSVSGKPGLYQIAEKGQTRPPDDMEMVVIERTSLLFPKKYIRAFYAMRDDYESQTGKKLGVLSAYRDVAIQAEMYQSYIKRNREDPQVAPPGYSLHNSAKALDLVTGAGLKKGVNANFRNSFLTRKDKQEAYKRAGQGEFGPVAQWLSQNSERFGFVWAGYSFRELWHYELDTRRAQQLGLLD